MGICAFVEPSLVGPTNRLATKQGAGSAKFAKAKLPPGGLAWSHQETTAGCSLSSRVGHKMHLPADNCVPPPSLNDDIRTCESAPPPAADAQQLGPASRSEPTASSRTRLLAIPKCATTYKEPNELSRPEPSSRHDLEQSKATLTIGLARQLSGWPSSSLY